MKSKVPTGHRFRFVPQLWVQFFAVPVSTEVAVAANEYDVPESQ